MNTPTNMNTTMSIITMNTMVPAAADTTITTMMRSMSTTESMTTSTNITMNTANTAPAGTTITIMGSNMLNTASMNTSTNITTVLPPRRLPARFTS